MEYQFVMYAVRELEPYLKLYHTFNKFQRCEEILHQHVEHIKQKLENLDKLDKVLTEIQSVKELCSDTSNVLSLLSSNMQFINKSSQEIITHLQPEKSNSEIVEHIVSTCFDYNKKLVITSRYAGVGPAFIHYVVDNYYRTSQLGNSPPTLKCVRNYLKKKYPNTTYNRFPFVLKDSFKDLKGEYESKTNKKAEHKD